MGIRLNVTKPSWHWELVRKISIFPSFAPSFLLHRHLSPQSFSPEPNSRKYWIFFKNDNLYVYISHRRQHRLSLWPILFVIVLQQGRKTCCGGSEHDLYWTVLAFPSQHSWFWASGRVDLPPLFSKQRDRSLWRCLSLLRVEIWLLFLCSDNSSSHPPWPLSKTNIPQA